MSERPKFYKFTDRKDLYKEVAKTLPEEER